MIRPHVNSDAYPGRDYETGGMDVTPLPYYIIDAAGQVTRDICGFGIPTEFTRWVTAAGARPGVNSFTIRDADGIMADFMRQLREEEETNAADSSCESTIVGGDGR